MRRKDKTNKKNNTNSQQAPAQTPRNLGEHTTVSSEKSSQKESHAALIISIIGIAISGFAVYYAREQANISKDALKQQQDSYKMQLLLEKPILKLDSVYCLTKTNGVTWNFAFNFSNTGKRPFKLTKGIFYVVNVDKDFLAGTLSEGADIKYTLEGFADVIKRSIPDSIMSDKSTSLLMQIYYEDLYLNRKEIFLHNFSWEGKYYRTGNLLMVYNEPPGLIDNLKSFIIKKEAVNVFTDNQ